MKLDTYGLKPELIRFILQSYDQLYKMYIMSCIIAISNPVVYIDPV